MTGDAAPGRRVFVAGTFNDWTPDDAAYELTAVEAGLWEGRVVIDRGGHAFKFAVDGNWDLNWGQDTAGSVIPPLEGSLLPDGANILLNVPLAGIYLFRVNTADNTWAVFPRQTGPGPAGALKIRENVGWLADFQTALESTSAAAAAENWLRTRLIPGDFNGQLPMLDRDAAVFVLWTNQDQPIHVAGSFNQWSSTEHRLERVNGTPLHYLAMRIPRRAAHQYKFVAGNHWFRDPHNRMVVWDGVETAGPGDFNSVIPPLPSEEHATHLVWIKSFYSLFLDDERDVFVMLPPGYRFDRDRHPVLYVNDGNECITRGRFDRGAAACIAGAECENVILVFVALPSPESRNGQYVEPEGRRRYARFLTRELVPFIDSHFNTRTDPALRGILGPSYGGANAFWTAWQHPEVFGKAGAVGGSFHVNDYELVKMLREGETRPVTFYLDSSLPLAGVSRGDNSSQSKAVAQALQEGGYRFLHVETEGERHDWTYWSTRFPHALRFFWPATSPRPARNDVHRVGR